METSLATVIIGLSVLSIVKLVSAATTQTGITQKYTTAYMLVDNIHELLLGLPFNDPIFGTHTGGPNTGQTSLSQFNDVEDFDGYAPSPPIDANRQPIASLANWQQSVSVTLIGDVNGHLLNGAGGTYSVVERVRVTISYRPSAIAAWTPILTSSWLKTKY
jgi:hypothetical protein